MTHQIAPQQRGAPPRPQRTAQQAKRYHKPTGVRPFRHTVTEWRALQQPAAVVSVELTEEEKAAKLTDLQQRAKERESAWVQVSRQARKPRQQEPPAT